MSDHQAQTEIDLLETKLEESLTDLEISRTANQDLHTTNIEMLDAVNGARIIVENMRDRLMAASEEYNRIPLRSAAEYGAAHSRIKELLNPKVNQVKVSDEELVQACVWQYDARTDEWATSCGDQICDQDTSEGRKFCGNCGMRQLMDLAGDGS